MELQYRNGQPAFGVGSVPVASNDRGEFRLFWFPPGEYYVRAEYSSAQSDLARKSYYPGTVDSNTAVALSVRGGESLDNLNFVIPTAPFARISGQVIPDTSAPVSGPMQTFYLLPLDGRPVEAYPLEFKNMADPRSTQDGSIPFALELRGVAPGLYDLAPFYMDAKNVYHSGRTRIEVGDQNIENVAAVITPNVEVIGRFIFEDNPLQGLGGLQFHLRAKDAAVPLMTRTSPAKVEVDGTFVIRDVFEGRYQLYLYGFPRNFPPDLYISAIRQGGQDIRNDGTIDVRRSMLPIEIRLRTGAGVVQGIVESPGGMIPPNADVVLVPQPALRGNALFYDRATISDKGQFKFEGVAPGEYKVFAFEQLADTAEQNSAFIARYETLGQSVTVNSRNTTEIRVRLLR
ncbi:MAG TPA: hypothetical protein VFE29_04620, partial [Terriglobia bacterium]|nr:hypothetical protein [Terriglobia bacterium]